MRAIVLSLLAAVLVPAFTASSFAGSPAPVGKNPVSTADSAWSSTILGFGVKTNDNYTDGNVFLTVPLISTIGRDGKLGGDYLFIEPYSSVGTGGEVAASLGLAWRHLFSDQSVAALQNKGRTSFMEEGWFLGTNLFVDMLDTQHNNQFWQLGVGAEVGNRYLQLTGNYYIPLSGRELADRNVSTQSFSNSSTSLSTNGSGFGDPFAAGNQILQNVNSTTLATTTTRTTTVRTVNELYEKGMEGWDAQLAVLVPWLDQWVDLKLIGGYFSFDNQPFGPQKGGTGKVHGWKAGTEFRPVPAVVLSAMWYQDERLTGNDWTVGVQLQVPLGKDWRDSFKPRRRHLVEQLAEPVHRQNDAVKIGNEEKSHSTSTTSVKRGTKVVSQKKGQIVLKDDVVFVNHGADVDNGIKAGTLGGTGTAESPVTKVEAGGDIAQANSNTTSRVWNVYTQGNGTPYVQSVLVNTGSVKFISNGSPIAGQGGKNFGTGSGPVINGGFYADSVGSFGVTGYTINNGNSINGNGIFASNIGSATITHNTINNASNDSIQLELPSSGVFTALIDSNTTTGGHSGLFVPLSGSGATLNITVTNNNVNSTTFSGLHIEASGSASITSVISNNQVSSAGNVGIRNNNFGSGSVNVTLNENVVVNPGIDGYKAQRTSSGALILNGSVNNTVSGEPGLKFDSVGGPTGTIILNGATVVLPSDVP